MLEAMFFSLPVIATDIPSIRAHFSEHVLLVPPQNESVLSEAMLELIKDQSLRTRMSVNAYDIIKDKYTWEEAAKQYESLF